MLRMTRAARAALIAHAQAEHPKEACGILAGRDGIATACLPMRNVDASPISYTMDPKEQLLIMKQLRHDRLEMMAIYHSHTATPAYPSPTDVRLVTYPDTSYVLVSLRDRAHPDVQSYRIADGAITPEELRLEPAA